MEAEEITSRSPTTKAILEGKSKIRFIGEEGGSTRTRQIDGTNWVGKEYTYAVDIPDGIAPGQPLLTELTVWSTTMSERWKKTPPTQLYIATGKGEMKFTNDEEVMWAVIDEISRQMDETRKEKS